jgi:hypothetical protein
MKPVVHSVRNADGSLQYFTAIPFLTVEAARDAGAAKVVDPNWIQQRIAEASTAEERGHNAAG